MNVYIGGTSDYSAMRGPCASGFHVPLQSEWQGVKTIMDGLGLTTGDNWKIKLHMPFAGGRLFSTAGLYSQGSNGYYWASSYYDSDYVSRLSLGSSSVNANSHDFNATGASVRCFKNSFELPTSSWTVINGTLGSAGIFRNQTDGLISITSDGTTGYTIQDKNLGATTVYSDGATLSEANCGKYYQRGNNYGFAWTGSVTTSSAQVNAQNYGPGNYYSSSTFIGRGSRPYGWDSSNNANLRGGVTGIVPAELKNAYIGEYTVPYLCFTANTASSTVQLKKTGGPTSVTLETSTDGNTWSTYTIGTTITLSNIGDKIYWRNTSETDTGFGIDGSNYYQFVMTGSIAGSGDINYLLNKNSTTTVSSSCYRNLFYGCTSLTTAPSLPATTLANYCYHYMFAGCSGLTIAPELPATTMKSYCYGGILSNCSSLTTAPSLPATTLDSYCYQYMFYNCTNLVSLPELPATTLSDSCYQYMFRSCSKIKLSTTQTGEYQTPYRIPKTGTGTTASNALGNMFQSTGGTFTGSASINTTYYTSNTVV